MKKSALLLSLAAFVLAGCAQKALPPAAYGPVPDAEQLEWQKMEYYMFVHFGPNTFTNVEWGDGSEDPDVFNPTALDCRQWAETAKAAGMKGIILTAKHHDGFCLWPSKFSTHTVRESKWRDGQGDVVRECAEACREVGIKFGVYISPWDRNHPTYGTPEYNEVFAGTLREVLTGYGDIFEQWLDGANGEGPNGKRQEYDWGLFHKTIYESQTGIVIFSDVGPDCRWIGNERGVAGETNWSRLDTEGFTPGLGAPSSDTLNSGNMHGARWVPGEVDTSIRPGWFYSPDTDDKVKTLAQLFDIYHTSVGRNANLLLNVPPDRTGRIHPADSIRLMELRSLLDATFSNNLLDGAKIIADNTRGGSKMFAPENMLSADYDAYWATDDDVRQATIEITLPKMRMFNRLQLQEYIPLGQRVAKWNAEWFDAADGAWKPLAAGTTVGYKRIVSFDNVTTDRVRINITVSLAPPVLNGVGLFLAPEIYEESAPQLSDNNCFQVTHNVKLPYKEKIDIRNVKYEISRYKSGEIGGLICDNDNMIVRYIPLIKKGDINLVLYPVDFGDFPYRFFLLTAKGNEVISELYVEGEWHEELSNKEHTSFEIDENLGSVNINYRR